MWELDHKESWPPKNWCYQTVVLEKTLESPWIAKKSNQSIVKEINPEYSLEELMQRADSLEKTLRLEKIESRRRRGWQRVKCLDSIIVSMDISLSKLREIVKDREDCCTAVHEVAESWTWFSDWTTITNTHTCYFFSFLPCSTILSNPENILRLQNISQIQPFSSS